MLIDCDHCTARPTACDHCVVGVLLGVPDVPARDAPSAVTDAPGPGAAAPPREPGGPLPAGFGPVEQRALEVLADHGLIPRLRLIASEPVPEEPPAAGAHRAAARSGHGRREVG